jgi:tripartite-type tricarboxylate transporter receptor subunit TctC
MRVKKIGFVLVLVCFFLIPYAWSQGKYPERTIEAIVGYTAGGQTDIAARIMADSLQKILGQPVIIVNKPGGAGAIAGNELFKRKPDGYSIGMFNANQPTPELFLNPERFIYKTGDLLAVAQWTGNPVGIFSKYDSPWKNFEEFVKYAKANPNKLRWGHTGKGNAMWIVGSLLIQKTGIKMLEVPFESGAQKLAALLGRHIELDVTTFGAEILPAIAANEIRPLCLGTPEKYSLMPEVPTAESLGYSLGLPEPHVGTFVRKGTPKEIIVRLEQAIKRATEDPEFRKKLGDIGLPIAYKNAAQYQEYVDSFAKIQYNQMKQLGVL